MAIYKHPIEFRKGDYIKCIDPCVGITKDRLYIVTSAGRTSVGSYVEITDDYNQNVNYKQNRFELGTPNFTVSGDGSINIDINASEQKENKYMESLEQLYKKYSGKVFGILVLILIDEVLLKGRIRKKLTESLHNIVADVMSTVDSDKKE